VIHHDARLPDGRAIRTVERAMLPTAIPDLTAALDACAGVVVNIEIKNDRAEPDHDPAGWVAAHVAAELGIRGPDARWLISSFDPETVIVCRRLLPNVPTGLLTETATAADAERAVDDGHTAIHPWEAVVDEAFVDIAHGLGLAVNVWTCNDPVRMRELIGWGVDGICTDVPDVAIAVRAEVAG
jgi:glycerophosphoryl diester phosphodiesterase